MSKVSYVFGSSSYKIFCSENHEENNSKRNKLNPSAILETIEEKYQEMIDDKRKLINESQILFADKRDLESRLSSSRDIADQKLKLVQSRLLKFTDANRFLLADKRFLYSRLSKNRAVANIKFKEVHNQLLKFTGKRLTVRLHTILRRFLTLSINVL